MRKIFLFVLLTHCFVNHLFCQTIDSAKSEALFDEGIVLYNQENYTKAIAKFEEAAELGGKRAEAYFQIGLSYKRLNRLNEAIRYFTKAIYHDSDYAEAYGYRAMANLDAENYQCALADFNEVIKSDTVNTCLYYHRGFAKSMLNNYQGAIEDYEYLLTRRSEFSESEVTAFYFSKAEAEYFRRNIEQAFVDFTKVVARDSTCYVSYLYLGYISHESYDDQEAIEYLDKCLNLESSSNDEALYLRGYCKYNSGIDDLGEADFRESAALGNRDAMIFLKENF